MSSVNSSDSLGALQWDVLELAGHLRQERLFIYSEQQNLQSLNEKVLFLSSELAQQAYVTSEQRVNLNRLIIARPDCSPSLCCERAKQLERCEFIDAYKQLQYQSCLSYGDLLSELRKSPKLLAEYLVEGEKTYDNMPGIIQSLASGLYGNCLLPEDKIFVLKLLRDLMSLQVIPSENPRRLLRHGTCAFSRLYSTFHESLFSAKLFLTAALHGPVMQLLMEEESYLDIDPDKILLRLSPAERAKKFGKETSADYQTRLSRHRMQVVNALARIAQRFIISIRENMHCFPTSVCWIVRQMAGLLAKNSALEAKEVHAMCTDLVFTYFICPAIVNPEPYGITDAPISAVARFNLMQVGQILQMLSLIKYQNVDQKVFDLYKKFDNDSVSSIIDAMLDGAIDDLDEEPSVFVEANKLQGLSRSAALFKETDLHELVGFLHSVSKEQKTEESEQSKRIVELLANLPASPVKTVASQSVNLTESSKKAGILGKVAKARAMKVSLSNSNLTNEVDENHQGGSGVEEELMNEKGQTILVIPFAPTVGESVGLLSEQKVLCMEIHKSIDGEERRETINCEVLRQHQKPPRNESQEKRTRFSLSHDEVMFEGSIGNTSDNLEAVSEAASNHSVASSLELETEDQNDNLSDMVSANVSERGTPNISGRDTPSSQITEGDDARRGEPRQLDLNRPSTISAKQSRSEIDDKFCKFEIKKLIEGDETVSLVSDTWSTDVLASDSETVEQQERFLLPAPPSQPVAPQTLPSESNPSTLDVSETASEAWSTDVLASDSERMTEVDTDDTASVARSDDTARSEIESRGEPEGGEETPPPVGNAGSGENAGVLFRPIREDPIGRAAALNYSSSLLSRPPSAHNVTGHGGTRNDYRQNTIEYVDNNLSNVAGINEDRLENLMDKMSMDDNISNSSSKSATNNPSNFNKSLDKLPNGHVKEYESEAVLSGLVSSSSSSNSSESSRGKCNNSTLQQPTLNNSVGDVVDGSNEQPSKASTSTGAIPKSISFDMTAERGDKELLDDDQKNKRGFFGKLKMSLRNRRGKAMTRGEERCFDGPSGSDDIGKHRLRRIMSEDTASSSNMNDSTDDILAKYRRKPSVASDTNSIESSHSRSKETLEDERLTIDPNNVESSFAFADAKRKLRKVLSMADLQYVPWTNITERNAWMQKENELVAFLQIQLAEAINLQNRSLIAHLHETLRCVRLFNDEGCRKLFVSLKDDYQKRSPYIAYLIRCRQGLLSTLAHLDRLAERVKSDRDTINNHLVSVCVRVFLEKKENSLSQFCDEFKKLTLADEKQDLVDNFLSKIFNEMNSDPIWQIASENQVELARIVVERTVMARVYLYALYPNGDGDIYRDQLLQDHIKKLSKIVTPTHKDLHIPKIYHYECPWPWAQEELAVISAYKTPREKLQCVFRCATTIMNLLSMASERGIPAADDLIPVLVYVIIKTNPPSLLSTIQYVESFYGNRLEGEEQYWWTQFCSAIEFIKTMD